MTDAVHDILHDWQFPPWLTLAVVFTAVLYTRGWLALRKTRTQQFNNPRLVSFLTGLTVLWLAIGSPMDGFADALLSAHMIEHLLLMSVVPPLLLLGLPAVPLLRGLPAPLTRLIAAPLIRLKPLRNFTHWLTQPIVAWLAMNLAFLGWHVPGAYNFALEHETWHAIEHLCFVSTSIVFWYCIIRPWPAEKHRRDWSILFFLISADVVNTVLSAFLAFCGRPAYRYYVENPNPFHISPLEDQVLGAVIMWVLGSLFFLVPAMLITVNLLTAVAVLPSQPISVPADNSVASIE